MFHVLELISNLKKCLLELKRVIKIFINIKVPVLHLYSYLIELIALFLMMLLGKYEKIFPNYNAREEVEGQAKMPRLW